METRHLSILAFAALLLGVVGSLPADTAPATATALPTGDELVRKAQPGTSLTAEYQRHQEQFRSPEGQAVLERELAARGVQTTTSLELIKVFATVFRWVDGCARWDESIQGRPPEEDLYPACRSTVILKDRGELLDSYASDKGNLGRITRAEEPPLWDFTEVALALRLPHDKDPLSAERFTKAIVKPEADGLISATIPYRGGSASLFFSPKENNAVTRAWLEWGPTDYLDINCTNFKVVDGRSVPMQITAESYSGVPAERNYTISQTFKAWRTGVPKRIEDIQVRWPAGMDVLETRVGVTIPVTNREGTLLTDELIADIVADEKEAREADAAAPRPKEH